MAGKADEKDEPQTGGVAAREAAQDTEPKQDAPTFTAEQLISGGFTDHEPHVLAGALAGLSKTERKTLTIDEANAAAKAWLSAPVKKEA